MYPPFSPQLTHEINTVLYDKICPLSWRGPFPCRLNQKHSWRSFKSEFLIISVLNLLKSSFTVIY